MAAIRRAEAQGFVHIPHHAHIPAKAPVRALVFHFAVVGSVALHGRNGGRQGSLQLRRLRRGQLAIHHQLRNQIGQRGLAGGGRQFGLQLLRGQRTKVRLFLLNLASMYCAVIPKPTDQ